MAATLTQMLARAGDTGAPIVIDGALGTALEARGVDLSHELWSAGLLRDDPGTIAEVHRDYIRAGARIVTTASYQATPLGFAALGLGPAEARALIARSVELAAEARRGDSTDTVLIAGSVGPYGAALGDGAEYTGDYSLAPAEFTDFHRPRIEALVEAGADLLAIETQPSLPEIAVLCRLADEHDIPAWISVTLSDGLHLADGTPLTTLAEVVSGHDSIRAVGVNCVSPSLVTPALRALAGATDLPLIAYPNSGEVYDAETMQWHSPTAENLGEGTANLGEGTGDLGEGTADRLSEGTATFPLEEWARAGARLIGGCCRTTPGDIAGIAAEVRRRPSRG